MSREIKFRGKDIRNNEWVYGGYYKHLKRTPSPIRDSIKDCDYEHLIIKSGFSDWNMPKPLECFIVEEKTVGECTGLKDKNGKEIYEGDIVKAYESNIICEVIFSEGAMFMLRWNDTKWGNNEYHHYGLGAFTLEVIGNIYEDKYLLGVENE